MQTVRTVRVASTGNIATLYNTLTIDGVALAHLDRVLVLAQTDPKQNGVYVVRADDYWYRADDWDTDAEVAGGALVFVMSGTANAGKLYALSAPAGTVVVGTDTQVFEQVGGTNFADLVAGAGESSHITVAVTAPTTDDGETEGFNQGDIWLDTSSNQQAYICFSAEAGNAAWVPMIQATSIYNLDSPTISGAFLKLSAQPAHYDTITVGTTTFQFVDESTSTVIGDDAYVAVSIGADLAATTANLLAAYNRDAADPHPTITLADTVTPAIGIGPDTGTVLSDFLQSDVLALVPAVPHGDGDGVSPGAPNLPLSTDLTQVGDVWSLANLRDSGARNPTDTSNARAKAEITWTVTSDAIEVGHALVAPHGFSVAGFSVSVRSSTGTIRANGTDTFVLSDNHILVTYGGGAAPDIQAGDVISIQMWE